jgi:ubiquitin-activating enzyme E1
MNTIDLKMDINEYDDSRYSRQSYSIGRESTQKLSKSKILIIGYDMLGEEIIKNMILMGVQEVDIYTQSSLDELKGENLFFNTVNNNIPIDRLRQLNPNTSIKIVNIKDTNDNLNIEIFKNYTMIILINPLINDAILLNKVTRSCEIQLIITGIFGLFGYIYNDFGNEFEIEDQDGEIYENLLIDKINSDEIKFRNKHKLNDKDVLILKYSNNYIEEKIINVINPFTVKFNSELKPNIEYYSSIIKKKIKKIIKNISFEEFIADKTHQKIITTDYSVPFERNTLLFNLYLGLNSYYDKFKELPSPWSQVDCNIFINVLKEKTEIIINEENINFIKKFCYTAIGNFKPLASIIGGIASHEIIKGITKKFIPIEQAVFIDFIDDLITDEEVIGDTNPCKYMSSDKYKSIVNIFGNDFINKLQSVKPFVIGSGAIGCEILKNLCCIGIKNITLTDNDNIEKSNLSRQLLFNDNDIGKSKSMCAGTVIRNVNNDCNVNIYENRIEKKTENIFDNEFHSSIDIYLNALDNVDARKYMDTMAVKYEKPIIDSGTTGAQGNIGVIIPHLTESYKSTNNDADEETIPLCTLKTFPFKVEHTIQWARELFEENFNVIPTVLNKYRKNNYEKLYEESEIELTNVYKSIYKFKNFKFDNVSFLIQCIIMYNNNFKKNIISVIKEYKDKPENTNKMPQFIINNEIFHIITSLTFPILNQVFKTNFECDESLIDKIEESQELSNYDENNIENINNYEKSDLINLIYEILNKFVDKEISPVDFEKDQDTLGHVKWITCCANARNFQYSINAVDEYETKKISGNIIPAMITTTSVISGYQIIEFIKIIKLYENQKYISNKFKKDINIYKDRYINLNINYHMGNNPSECKKHYFLDENNSSSDTNNKNYLTLWSKFTSQLNNTNEILKSISEQTNKLLTVYLIDQCENPNNYIVDDEIVQIKNTNSEYCIVIFNEYDMEFFVTILENFKINKKT